MFSPNHFLWIALCVLCVLLGLFFAKRFHLNCKQASLCMTAICFISETSKMMTHMLPSSLGGMTLDPQALPFHLCSLLIFAVLYITFGTESPKKQVLIDFLAPMGLMGGCAAILIPTDGVDFLDPLAYQCFLYHAGLVWFSLYLILSKQANMTGKAFCRNLLILAALVGMMMYVNGALYSYGTNFLFLVRPPVEGLPLLNLDHGWYCYFAVLVCLALGVITLFYLPFFLSKKKRT